MRRGKSFAVLITGLLLMFMMGFIGFMGFAGAITTSLKDNYQSGETIIFSLSGNILEAIAFEQVSFLRGYVKLPLEYNIKKLGDNYYVWAIAPTAETENNYSFVIKDLFTTVNGKEEKIDFVQNFTISGNLTDYSIKPGLIFAKDDFEIDVQLNEDLDKTIEVGSSNRSVVLKPGENTISFEKDDFVGAKLNLIKIGKYELPAYVIGRREYNLSNVSAGNLSDGEDETDKESSVPEEEIESVDYYCSELPGRICAANEICKGGNSVQAIDGKCCVSGTCTLEETKSSTGQIIGFILLGVAFVVAVYIWYRYKKGNPINFFSKKVGEAEAKAKGLP